MFSAFVPQETLAKPKEAAAAPMEVVALSTLPREAQATHKLILAGGPFAHSQDGIVFGNRERLLPAKARGYYHEYTVRTPGERTRGARRMVCGGKPPTAPEVCYYTDDHYASFKRLAD
ncbi:ribonuclease domain-containing protein [Burkholderiaceae bacterium UC74_6]